MNIESRKKIKEGKDKKHCSFLENQMVNLMPPKESFVRIVSSYHEK